MTTFRVKQIDTGIPDDWLWRVDETASPGDDIVAADPNDLGAAITDTQYQLLKISTTNPTNTQPGDLYTTNPPGMGVIERIINLEDILSATAAAFSLQTAYDRGNEILLADSEPFTIRTSSSNVPLSIDIDTSDDTGIVKITPSVFHVRDVTSPDSKYLSILGSSILGFGDANLADFTIGTRTSGNPGISNTVRVLSGRELYLQDARTLEIPFSDSDLDFNNDGIDDVTVPFGLPGSYPSIMAAFYGIYNAVASASSLQGSYDLSSSPQIQITGGTTGKGPLVFKAGTGHIPPVEVLRVESGWIRTDSLETTSGLASIKATGDIIGLAVTANNGVQTNLVSSITNELKFEDENTRSVLPAPISINLTDASNKEFIDPPGGITTITTSIVGGINNARREIEILDGKVTSLGDSHDLTTGDHTQPLFLKLNNDLATAMSIRNSSDTADVLTVNGDGRIIAPNANIGIHDIVPDITSLKAHRDDINGTSHANLFAHMNNKNNPHDSVGKIIAGPLSSQFIGDVRFSAGTGIRIDVDVLTNEISVANTSATLQEIYDGSSTGVIALVPTKGLRLDSSDGYPIAVFSEDVLGNKVASFTNNVGLGFGQDPGDPTDSTIEAFENLEITSGETLTLSNTEGGIYITPGKIAATDTIYLEGIPFQPATPLALPTSLPTLMESMDFNLDNFLIPSRNTGYVALPKGTAVTMEPRMQLEDPATGDPIVGFLAPCNTFSSPTGDFAKFSGLIHEDVPAASDVTRQYPATIHRAGQVEMDIGTMSGGVGGFRIGDTLYVGRKGFAKLSFVTAQTGSVTAIDVIGIDTTDLGGGMFQNVVMLTAKTGTADPTKGEFLIPTGTGDSFVAAIASNILNALRKYTQYPRIVYAFPSGKYATATVSIGTVITGTTYTIARSGFPSFAYVASATKTTDLQFVVGATPEITAFNLAESINTGTRGPSGHQLTATATGASIMLKAITPTNLSNISYTLTPSAGTITTTQVSGGADEITLFMIGRETGTTTNATLNIDFFQISNFSADENINSQFITETRLNDPTRPKALFPEKDIKVGLITDLTDPTTGTGATISFTGGN